MLKDLKKKKKKVSFTKKQLNKTKRMQAKVKAKASERKRKKLAKGNVNIPRKYKYKYTSKRVSHNGGVIKYKQLPKKRGPFLWILSTKAKYCGEFSIKHMIRLSTRVQRRRKRIKVLLKKKCGVRFYKKESGYKRYIRAYVSYSERALGLRLGRGKSKLGGWRIPLKANQVLFYGNLILAHGKNNWLKKTQSKMAFPALYTSASTYNYNKNYVPR